MPENHQSFQTTPPISLSKGPKQLLGLIGASLLFIGVFTPIISYPMIGSLNAFQHTPWEGPLILILAGNPFRGLADKARPSIQIRWGWALLVAGAWLLMASAALKAGFERGPTRTKCFLNQPATKTFRALFVGDNWSLTNRPPF